MKTDWRDATFYGKATKLDPPITIDGQEYNLAVRFDDEFRPNGNNFVTSAIVDSVNRSGAFVEIAFRRSLQTFSRTISDEFGNAFEEIYNCLMGGNVCRTHEPQRGYSRLATRAHRGDDVADRAIPNDVLVVRGRRFQITAANAFAVAPASVRWQGGSVVGIAPRMPGTENLATQDSATVAENLAHYSDFMTIHDPHGLFTGEAGDPVQVERSAVFLSTDPPAFSFDLRDVAETTWATVDPSNYLLFASEGLVLFKSSWVDDKLDSGLCVRAKGKCVTNSGSMQARQVNEFAVAMESLDEAWLPVPLSMGGTPAVAGFYQEGNPGPSTQNCFNGQRRVGDWLIGNTRNLLNLYREGLANVGRGTGRQVGINNTTGGWGVAVLFFDGGLPALTTINCGAGDISNSDLLHDTALGRIWPWPDYPPQGIPTSTHFGSNILLPPPDLADNFPVIEPGSFRFNAREIEMPHFFADLPQGSEIIQATILAKFDGLSATNWSMRVDAELPRYAGAPAEGTQLVRVDVNGERVREWTIEDGLIEDNAPGESQATASMAVYLLAERRDTQLVEAVSWPAGVPSFNTTTLGEIPVSGGRYRSFGSSSVAVGSTAAAGKWRRINALGLARGLHRVARSQYGRLFIVPGRDVDLSASDTRLIQYARAVAASQSLTTFQTADNVQITWTANGAFVNFDDWAIRDLMVRFRMPSGIVGTKRFPLILPPIDNSPS